MTQRPEHTAAPADGRVVFGKVAVFGPDGRQLDVGTLTARRHRLEFEGQRLALVLPAVRAISVGGGPRVRVDYDGDDGPATVYLMKTGLGLPGRVVEVNRRFAGELTAAVGPAGLSEADQERLAADLRSARSASAEVVMRRAKTGIWVFALIAVAGAAGTLISYRVAHPGDRYVILTGAIVVGVVFCLVSVLEYLRARRERDRDRER